VTPHGVGRCPKDRGDGRLSGGGRMSAFTAVFFSSPNSPGFPLWQYTMQVRLSETVSKNVFLNLRFETFMFSDTSHTGQRGTPPGERGREKENRSKNRHFPPSSPDRRPSPLSASLTSPRPAGSHPLRFSSLDSLFPHPLSPTHCRFLLLLRPAG